MWPLILSVIFGTIGVACQIVGPNLIGDVTDYIPTTFPLSKTIILSASLIVPILCATINLVALFVCFERIGVACQIVGPNLIGDVTDYIQEGLMGADVLKQISLLQLLSKP